MIGISVIMPTFNRGYCIEKTIESVIMQTYPSWELIVVDNNSSDNTRDIVSGLSDERISFFQVNNQGVIAISRNFGIARARGEYVAFIDSDDPWVEDKLEVAIDYLSRGNRLVFHDLMVFNGKDKLNVRKQRLARSLHKPIVRDLLERGNGIPTSSVVVEKRLLDDVGAFKEKSSLVGIEDYDLRVRIARETDKFCYIDRVLGYYTDDGSGTLNLALRERSLRGIINEHKELHIAMCGKTPDWLVVAWTRCLLSGNSHKACRYALSYLRERRSFVAVIKLLCIAAVAFMRISFGFLGKSSRRN